MKGKSQETAGPLQPAPDLSVVVASYNAAPLLRECLTSLRTACRGLVWEAVVVDNRSTDGSARMVAEDYPWVRLLRNDRNEGFARANNRAFRITRGRYLLLLNPDTLMPPGTLHPMVVFLDEHPDVGMAGCRLERPDGGIDEACKRSFPTPLTALARFLYLDRLFPRNRRLGSYRRTWQDPSGRYEVDSVVGAFMLLRREVLDDVGGLDEDFFMFGEDLDWCYRIKSRRWKVFYLGDRYVIHHKGASTSIEPHRMNFHFHRSMLLFHRKHMVNRYPFFVNWLVYVGISLRYALKSTFMLVRRVRPRSRDLTPERAAELRRRVGLDVGDAEAPRESAAEV